MRLDKTCSDPKTTWLSNVNLMDDWLWTSDAVLVLRHETNNSHKTTTVLSKTKTLKYCLKTTSWDFLSLRAALESGLSTQAFRRCRVWLLYIIAPKNSPLSNLANYIELLHKFYTLITLLYIQVLFLYPRNWRNCAALTTTTWQF